MIKYFRGWVSTPLLALLVNMTKTMMYSRHSYRLNHKKPNVWLSDTGLSSTCFRGIVNKHWKHLAPDLWPHSQRIPISSSFRTYSAKYLKCGLNSCVCYEMLFTVTNTKRRDKKVYFSTSAIWRHLRRSFKSTVCRDMHTFHQNL